MESPNVLILWSQPWHSAVPIAHNLYYFQIMITSTDYRIVMPGPGKWVGLLLNKGRGGAVGVMERQGLRGVSRVVFDTMEVIMVTMLVFCTERFLRHGFSYFLIDFHLH